MDKIAFLFPGQGAQQVGMCREICEALPAARELLERANDVLRYDLAKICFEGPEDRLNSTVVSQPALYVSSFLALEKLRDESPQLIDDCQAAAGLSLGEYTAIAFAGGFSFEDGLKLVQRRGEAMQAAADETPSGMVSVLGLERSQVAEVCDAARQEGEILQIANLLCPGNTAVSGHQESCNHVAAVAESAGAMKSIPLAVAGAFHTLIMESAVAKLESALAEVEIQPSRIPVYSNVDAKPHTEPDEFRELLVRQVCSPVLWHDSIQQLLDDDFNEFFEVGYGRVLRGLMKRIARRTPCHGVLE
ncbi:MAG: ACP S-malonyltransferase [Mariniblastus sp.]|nr:ACP S-malonyltransferase [Mariniblastus sp.]